MFRLFKTPSHRKFEHSPIYYDPEKEDLQRRLGQAEGRQSRVASGELKERWSRNHDRLSAQNKASNMRILVILMILGAMFWWIFLS
ncbi:MAG: hypothetical protein LPK45_04070 [Bacteroidota bacterium]|nr:hypothetical protein [Bacteroidota bacterium]MDX5430229.1 hypothetical protein [Bacteroidota bacterium]MDX5468990.1 hypothetical protein [Bacteroidota bacterium]